MADLSSLLGSAGIGGAIGKAIVSLELETTKYQAELKSAQAQTVASTNASSQTMGKFSSVASTAWLAVGAAAVAGAAFSVKAAVEANDAQLKLQNTFENNPKLADSSVEAFTAMADSLRDLTGVDDEAIISSEALLGQFDLTGDQVLELTPLIVDLSEKMGIDLEAATRAVGKATQGNTGALSRYGISVDEADTATGQFTETVEGLGVAQGFAAESAKAEPWRVLSAQFEEVAENIGQALIPVLQAIVPVLQDIVTLLGFATSGFKDFDQAVQDAGTNIAEAELSLASWVLQHTESVPVIGRVIGAVERFQDATEESNVSTGLQAGLVESLSAAFRDRLTPEVKDTSKQMVQFAHKTSEEIKEWSDKVKDSFDAFVLVLDESTEATQITRKEFIDATNAMQREARQLAGAMREISKEKWINDEYVAFLSEQGPEWLIGFTKLTEDEQRKAQKAWQDSTDKTDAAKESLDKITGVLDVLGRGDTKHKVTIEYDYVGFDPSKPGMSGGATSPQQRP